MPLPSLGLASNPPCPIPMLLLVPDVHLDFLAQIRLRRPDQLTIVGVELKVQAPGVRAPGSGFTVSASS